MRVGLSYTLDLGSRATTTGGPASLPGLSRKLGGIGSLSPGGSAILTVLSKAFPLELGAGKFIYLCYTGKETQAA